MKILNVGCCNNYIEGAVNIDIDPRWKCDIVLDIAQPLIITENFGNFDKIIATSVLEHVSDLVKAMTNCRDLLKEGGTMEIEVPYDLSYGAWKDPTHMRAFNQQSWEYYWQEAWRLGWTEYGLRLVKLNFGLSPWAKPDASIDDLISTPRAISNMELVLAKEKLP
jgi:SAM-dependent methyltransferase